MKKIISLLSTVIFMVGISKAQRFETKPGGDNTGRVITYDYKTPAFSSALNVNANAFQTFVKPTVSGNMTVTAGTTVPKVCDNLHFILTNSSGTDRVVTFSTGITSSGNVTVANGKTASRGFIFNGSKWVETYKFAE